MSKYHLRQAVAAVVAAGVKEGMEVSTLADAIRDGLSDAVQVRTTEGLDAACDELARQLKGQS